MSKADSIQFWDVHWKYKLLSHRHFAICMSTSKGHLQSEATLILHGKTNNFGRYATIHGYPNILAGSCWLLSRIIIHVRRCWSSIIHQYYFHPLINHHVALCQGWFTINGGYPLPCGTVETMGGSNWKNQHPRPRRWGRKAIDVAFLDNDCPSRCAFTTGPPLEVDQRKWGGPSTFRNSGVGEKFVASCHVAWFVWW